MPKVDMNYYGLPGLDIEEAVDLVGSHWKSLDGMRLFFTGGTGFVGTWMMAVLLRAIERNELRADSYLLTRNPDKFRLNSPEIANNPRVHLIKGDLVGENWNCAGCSHLVAGATEPNTRLLRTPVREVLDTMVEGTRVTLDRALDAGISRALFISSGAVYGRQPADVTLTVEDQYFGLNPLDPRSVYGEGKRISEMMFLLSAKPGFSFSCARLWAFIGPLLPLDGNFAIGNFIGDSLANRTIRIMGDGTAVRSFQYASEMAAWNWILLASGKNMSAYNVGSEHSITISQLARLCSELFGGREIEIMGHPNSESPSDIYVPSTKKFRTEFGVTSGYTLQDSLQKTIKWHKANSKAFHNYTILSSK